MRTDIAFDKICDITPIVCDIVDKANSDEELRKVLFEGLKQPNATRSAQLRYLAQVLKKCRDEAFEILAIIYDKTVEEVKEQDFITVTIPQVVEIWNNPEVQRLFFSSSKTPTEDMTEEGKVEEESSPISENIAAETEQPVATSSPFAGI